MKRHINFREPIVWILATLMLIGVLSFSSISAAKEGKWMKKADMPTARSGLAACVVNGKIYAIAGWLPSGALTTTVEEYDPVKDIWTKKADMPTARGGLAASVVNGKIYAIGGEGGLSKVEEYDPVVDKWTKKANMPTPRWALSTSVVDGRIYAIGGLSIIGPGPSLSTVEVYNPTTDKWTKKSDMPTARMGLSTGVVNGEIYAIGGQPAGVWVWWNALSAVEVYNPATDKWMKKADMPTPRTELSCSVVNGEIYVIGGAANFNTAFSTVEVYDSATDKWVKKADMPTARMYFSTSEVNGKLYAIGGWTGNVDLATVEEYTPEGWPFAVSPQGKLATTWGEIKRR